MLCDGTPTMCDESGAHHTLCCLSIPAFGKLRSLQFGFVDCLSYSHLGHIKDHLHQDLARILAVVSFLPESSAVVLPDD